MQLVVTRQRQCIAVVWQSHDQAMKKPAGLRRRLRRGLRKKKRSGVRVKAVLNHRVRGGGHYSWRLILHEECEPRRESRFEAFYVVRSTGMCAKCSSIDSL
jgi:hypothetical protein